MKTTTKTSTFPPLRVNDEVRAAAEAALAEGETLSAFVLEAIQLNIQRRALQQEFVARGLAARDEARRTGLLAERDAKAARRARSAIAKGIEFLRTFPFSCRKASPEHPLLRELIISFGANGYVALFDIEDGQTVTVLAVRHQREEDFF